MLPQVISQESLHKICSATMHSGREYVKKHKTKSPLMYAYYKTEYLGKFRWRAFERSERHPADDV